MSVPELPFLRIQNHSPSVRAICQGLPVRFLGRGLFKEPHSMLSRNPFPSTP